MVNSMQFSMRGHIHMVSSRLSRVVHEVRTIETDHSTPPNRGWIFTFPTTLARCQLIDVIRMKPDLHMLRSAQAHILRRRHETR